MKRLLYTHKCRRETILSELDDDSSLDESNECCDNCQTVSNSINVTVDSLRLLKIIYATTEHGLAKNSLLEIMIGKSIPQMNKMNRTTKEIIFKEREKEKSKNKELYWKELFKMLVYGGLIDFKYFDKFDSPIVSEHGLKVMEESKNSNSKNLINLIQTLQFLDLNDSSVRSPINQADSKGVFRIPINVKYGIQCSSSSQKELFTNLIQIKNAFLIKFTEEELKNYDDFNFYKSIIKNMVIPKSILNKEFYSSLEVVLNNYLNKKYQQLVSNSFTVHK